MEHTWLLHNLIVALGLLEECSAFPIHLGAGGIWSAGVASPLTPIALGAATLLAALVLLMGCVCCRQQKGFQDKPCMQDGSCGQHAARQRQIGWQEDGAGDGRKLGEQGGSPAKQDVVVVAAVKLESVVVENNACNGKELVGIGAAKEFTDSVSSQNNLESAAPHGSGHSHRAASELTLFPPLGTTLNQPGDRSSVVQFEPLPDIHVVAAAAAAARRKPAAFGNTLHHGLSVHDWFEGSVENFPRQQLQYLRELGRGWFGRVVEGKAKEIIPGHATSKVIVKILHEDATPTDQSYFLHEAKPYKTLKHPNVLRLIGRCLETHPFLLLLEDCSSGTLKTFLAENRTNAEKFCEQGVLLEMACGVAAGLHHMVENGFVHTDLAARNCLVSSDLTVKVGDYGTNIETFKDEYYCVSDLAIPIRWVAPETLHCTDTTIETKEVTASANVWSLSIVLWEICEFGKLPYTNLSDDEVIEQVLGKCSTNLPFPTYENQPHVHNLYHLMKICWVEAEKRPPLWRVAAMLKHLVQHKSSPAHTSANNNNNSTTSLDDFERRWELSKPNSVPKIDNQVGTTSMQTSPVKSVLLQRCASLEDNSASTAPHLELNTATDKSRTTASANSPQLSVSSSCTGDGFIPSPLVALKSPSLQNLRGSVDELYNSESKEGAHDIKNRQAPETVAEEGDFDSWLKGMDTSTEEDVRFVRNISEAIRDLDEVLAQEKTSSSSQNSSAQPSPSQITSRDSKPESTIFTSQDQKFTLDFRLGQAAASSFISHNIGLLHSHGHESLSLSQHRLESSGSDTEDETWRIRIERGEFSEKVKEKSRSVADLMVLTHIDYSDGSDSDTTLDLDSCGSTFRKNGAGRRSFNRKPLQSSSSITYGSEGNIHQAVLGEEFQETIKKLQESLRDGSKLEAIPDVSLSCISMSSNDAHDNVPQAQFPLDQSHFLAKLASENKMMKNDGSRATLSVALNTKLDEEQNNFKTEESNTSSENGESEEKLETPLNGDAYFASSGITSVTSHPLETILNYSEDREPGKEGSLKEGKEEISNINGHCNSISGEKFLIASTPISRESNSIRHSDIDTFDMDSSLLCSQSLSLIESEKSDSIVCSPANRPPSPTPDDIETKNESSSCVILGPFEDSTLDYFKGLKTAFPVMKTLNYDTTNEMDLEENSIETWDKFLDHAMQPENCDYPSFSDVSFQKLESESQGSDSNAPSASSDILGSSFERSLPEKLTVGSPVPHLDVKLSEFPAFNGHQPQGDASESGDGKEAEIGLESQVSACAVSTNKVLDPASLVVPSVNVIAATPITSGRNTPNDLTNSDIDSVSSVTKEYPDVTGCLEDNIISDIKIVSEDSEKVYQNLKDSFSQNQFAVPEIKMSGGNTPKFDPDLPCCNLSDRDFVSDDKSFDLQNSAFDIFSTSVDGTPNGNFVEVLETGCYTSSSLDGELTDKGFKPVIPLFSKTFDSKEDANGEILEDDDDFGLGVAKNLTPDDERSSDSGFRDKGSLSESCEDACDEKYNLEDIEAELEEAFSKGVFARQDSPTSNKGVESDCEAVDESFSVTLTDVEKQRELREAEINQSRDPCHRLDDLLRCDQMHEPLSVDVESSVDFFGTSPALSPIPQSSGWYLHPPQVNEETHAEPISGNDSSYFSFNLDEEFVNAIRNELREKLPCAQMQREEHQPQLSDEEDNSDELDSDDSPSRERTNIMIHYKTYPAPLSPILEERESLCSESFSPLGGCNSSSCSEQLSPVFAVDRSPSNQGDGDVRHMESECPAEVDGDLSDDCGDCGDFDEISEHDALPLDLKFNSPSSLNEVPCSIDLCMNDDGDENDDDDVLIVNTETNEATLLESPKPTGKFSFGNDECDDSIHDDFVPDFLSVAGSYQLPESKLNNVERMRSDLYLGNRPLTLATLPQSSVDIEFEDDNNSMTPDSITCEKSFSERTEDSAVGLALSEVMTPDSLAGETQWTSAQMCDSGFGTIISTVPSSSGPSADRRSSEVESIIIEPDAAMGILPPASDKTLIKEDDAVESTEATHSTEDSESSVSVSSHSVIAGPLPPNSGDSKTCATEDHVVLASSDPLTSSDIKKDLKLFIMEEAKFSSSVSSSSPQSLKEMAKNTIKSKCSSTVQTLAFNNEDFLEKSHLISTEKTTHCVPCTANGSQSSTSKIIEDLEFENKNLKQSRLEMHEPLQTLAFSDADVTERNNFPGLGHIVVSSIIAPLTPSDETLIPGTLAFNESPESPRAILSPIFKENDSTEAESHLMSTSFMSADDVYEDHDHFTPDWESGSDGCESETASSSSGEFIWKDGERESSVKAVNAVPDSALSSAPDQQTYNQNTTEFPMSSIMEEEEDEDNSGSSSCTSDSEDDTEFVPSAWDSQATPSRSALRSPEKKVEHKKNVSFKRQRYHCVYEYPRELSDSDGSEFADSPSRRRTWDLENSTYNMHDWDLAVNEGMAETSCQDDTKDEQLSASPSASQKLYEFYKLSSADYGFGSTMLSEDGEFFISSSAQPFHTLGEAGPSGGSEFFPGRDLTVSSVDDGDVVDGPMDHNSVKSGLPTNSENQNWRHTEDFSDSDSSDTNMITASEGSFNQQQSGDSNSSSTPMVTANGSSKSSEDSSIYHSIPSNQELQVDSGSDSPLSELSPTSPLSPSSPSHGLGELRHTRDRLKLDLPAANTTFVLVAPCKRRSVEQVKGEASLLDGEDGLKGSKACVNETLPVSSNVH